MGVRTTKKIGRERNIKKTESEKEGADREWRGERERDWERKEERDIH
jgi:hypothetical protein